MHRIMVLQYLYKSALHRKYETLMWCGIQWTIHAHNDNLLATDRYIHYITLFKWPR